MPCLRSDDLSISCASVAADSGGKNNETSGGAFNARNRHVQRERLTAAQAKPRRGGDRSGALVARDAKGYVSSPSPSSERRDCGSPLLARQFRSPAFKETFCYSRGATTKPPHLSDSLLASLVTQPHPSGRGFLLCGSGGTDARPHVRIEDPRHIKAPPERARCSASG